MLVLLSPFAIVIRYLSMLYFVPLCACAIYVIQCVAPAYSYVFITLLFTKKRLGNADFFEYMYMYIICFGQSYEKYFRVRSDPRTLGRWSGTQKKSTRLLRLYSYVKWCSEDLGENFFFSFLFQTSHWCYTCVWLQIVLCKVFNAMNMHLFFIRLKYIADDELLFDWAIFELDFDLWIWKIFEHNKRILRWYLYSKIYTILPHVWICASSAIHFIVS